MKMKKSDSVVKGRERGYIYLVYGEEFREMVGFLVGERCGCEP